jgi:hypothetical protein
MGTGAGYVNWSDPMFNQRAQFEYRFSIIPRQCYLTGQWIWGRHIRARAVWHGPGDPAIEDRWYHKDQALVMLIQQGTT